MSGTPDWRLPVLKGAAAVDVPAARRNPIAWPGYTPRQAVSVWRLRSRIVVAVWDFSVFGAASVRTTPQRSWLWPARRYTAASRS